MAGRAIVVDDHAAFRSSARRLLELAGYDVVGEAGDGSSALALARELEPELVLLDIALPDMSGFDVAEALAGGRSAVVLVSSRAAADLGKRASRMGPLMTVVAFWLLERKLQYSHEPGEFTFGYLFGELGFTAAFAHAVLAYPTGRLRTRFERIFIGAGYGVVIAFSLAQLAFWSPAQKCIWGESYCAAPQPRNLLLVHADNGVFLAIRDAYRFGIYGVLALVFIALIAQRVRSASPAGRRLLAPMMLGGFVEGTYGLWQAAHVFTGGAGNALYWWQIGGQMAVALALLAG